MSFDRSVRYPTKWLPPTGSFPFGVPKNSTTETSKDGVPFEKDFISDTEGFFQGLLSRRNISLSGNPDTALISDYLDALGLMVGITHATISDAIADTTLKVGMLISTQNNKSAIIGGGANYLVMLKVDSDALGITDYTQGNHISAVAGLALILLVDNATTTQAYGTVIETNILLQLNAAIDSTNLNSRVDIAPGNYLVSSFETAKHFNIAGKSSSETRLLNADSAGVMFLFDQTVDPYDPNAYAGSFDVEKRNWKTFSDMMLIGNGSLNEIGIHSPSCSSLILSGIFFRGFLQGEGAKFEESLWVTLDHCNANNSQITFNSSGAPKNINGIQVTGGEYRNPTTGQHAILVNGAEVVQIDNVTIEGETGGAGALSGLTVEDSDFVKISSTYVEKLSNCADGFVLDNVRFAEIENCKLGSNSDSVPSLHVKNGTQLVKINTTLLGSITVDDTVGKIIIENTAMGGLMDIAEGVDYELKTVRPFGSTVAIVARPESQNNFMNYGVAHRNTNHDSSYILGEQVNSVQSGTPVVSHETTEGYTDNFSTKIVAASGDKIRLEGTGSKTFPGLIENNDDRFCISFMMKSTVRTIVDFSLFSNGVKGSPSQYVNTEWRRYFLFSNDADGTLAAGVIFFDIAFNDTCTVLIDDMQVISFGDFAKADSVIDDFRYINTSINNEAISVGIDVKTDEVFLDNALMSGEDGIGFKQLSVVPPTPKKGVLYFADGAGWNPGSGNGLYFYDGTTFNKLY